MTVYNWTPDERRWGNNYDIVRRFKNESGDCITLIGWRWGLNVGDVLLLHHVGGHAAYVLDKVSYYDDPYDMFQAEAHYEAKLVNEDMTLTREPEVHVWDWDIVYISEAAKILFRHAGINERRGLETRWTSDVVDVDGVPVQWPWTHSVSNGSRLRVSSGRVYVLHGPRLRNHDVLANSLLEKNSWAYCKYGAGVGLQLSEKTVFQHVKELFGFE